MLRLDFWLVNIICDYRSVNKNIKNVKCKSVWKKGSLDEEIRKEIVPIALLFVIGQFFFKEVRL